MISPQPEEDWWLITTAYHMPRSYGVFCRQGWRVIPYPVDYQTLDGGLAGISLSFTGNLGGLSAALREWIGLLAYRLTDKTNRLFPGPGDSCSL